MSESPPTTLLEDAIDIPVWLEADALNAAAERSARDREIAGTLPTFQDCERVRAWWRKIADRRDGLPGHSLVRARTWVSLALVIVGLAAGTGLALAAFRYDGTFPVNVVRLLALLVAPQLLLLAFNLLLIPGRLPGLRFLQDALAAINPGALAGAVYRQLTNAPQGRVFGWASAPSTAARRFGKWQMLRWSQITAVAFNLAVIATAAMLIAFTDLAFGWSTTLEVTAETASRIVAAIAAPWAAFLPEAVPDSALVERSQFFRLAGQSTLPDSRALTQWWSFALLAIIVYGLIPRLAFLLLTGWRLRVATRAMLLEDPRVVDLLDRMSAPAVETRGAAHAELDVAAEPAVARAPRSATEGSASAVVWSQTLPPDRAAELIRQRLGMAASEVLEVGSGSLAADRSTIAHLAAAPGPVVILTPAWEPPLLEFVDFLGVLRRTIGPSRSIIVVPVADGNREVTAAERDNWSLAVAKSGDDCAYVEGAGT